MMRMLRHRGVYDAWLEVDDPAKLPSYWKEDLDTFKRIRQGYLLYD